MIDRQIVNRTLVAFVLCCVCAHVESNAQQEARAIFRDDTLGIAFAKIGAVEKIDNATYRIMLPSSDKMQIGTPAIAEVSATDRLYVDLPGSYGGRVYYDTPSATRLFQNRVLIDSVLVGQQNFHREYWIVYAGMGMWESVINCYMQETGRYYIVSLLQEVRAGKPGDDVDGLQLTAEGVQKNVLSALRDTTNTIVGEFTTMLNTVQISR